MSLVNQKVKDMFGEAFFSVALLQAEVAALREKIQDLEAKLKEQDQPSSSEE